MCPLKGHRCRKKVRCAEKGSMQEKGSMKEKGSKKRSLNGSLFAKTQTDDLKPDEKSNR